MMQPSEVSSRLVCPFRLGLDHVERLAVVGLKGDPRPDQVLRFGYAAPMPRSLRRPVAAVIED
jgi:hypothetical protein